VRSPLRDWHEPRLCLSPAASEPRSDNSTHLPVDDAQYGLRQLGDVGGDAPGLIAGQTDSSPSMAGIALLMPVNRAGAVEYEIDENNGIKA
jgi:hypothetical protein